MFYDRYMSEAESTPEIHTGLQQQIDNVRSFVRAMLDMRGEVFPSPSDDIPAMRHYEFTDGITGHTYTMVDDHPAGDKPSSWAINLQTADGLYYFGQDAAGRVQTSELFQLDRYVSVGDLAARDDRDEVGLIADMLPE